MLSAGTSPARRISEANSPTATLPHPTQHHHAHGIPAAISHELAMRSFWDPWQGTVGRSMADLVTSLYMCNGHYRSSDCSILKRARGKTQRHASFCAGIVNDFEVQLLASSCLASWFKVLRQVNSTSCQTENIVFSSSPASSRALGTVSDTSLIGDHTTPIMPQHQAIG